MEQGIPLVGKVCEECGVFFLNKKWNSGRFCSRSCAGKSSGKNSGGKYKIKANKDFFKTWTPEMAYTVGFIAADGCITKHSESSWMLRIMSTDRDILEKINPLLGDAKIRKRQNGLTKSGNKCKPIHSIAYYDRDLIKHLVEIGVVPRKSYTMGPLSIPDQYFWQFLRGFTDGDGCVRKRISGGYVYPEISWSGGSQKFMVWLRDKIEALTGLHVKVYDHCRRKSWVIVYSASSATKLLDLVYANTDLYMDRKMEKYHELKQLEAERSA